MEKDELDNQSLLSLQSLHAKRDEIFRASLHHIMVRGINKAKMRDAAMLYNPRPELKSKPGELALRGDFENAVKKQGEKLTLDRSGRTT